MDLLSFQKEIVHQIRGVSTESASPDGIWVIAEGLGLRDIFQAAIIAEECEAKQLGDNRIILVLNCGPEELWRFPAHRYTFINTDLPSKQRTQLYLQGGLVFGSSRIFVVDMLKRRLSPHLIRAIVIMDAHTVSDSSTEAFILRLYNNQGKVWAFTDRVHHFAHGFAKISKTMDALGVSKPFLWPRFRKSVKTCLAAFEPQVFQLFTKMTSQQEQIHSALLAILTAVISEISKPLQGSNEDIADLMRKVLSVENSLFRSFHEMLRAELEPKSNRLSYKTRQLIRDLDSLRKLLVALLRYDAVTFYSMLQKARRREWIDASAGSAQSNAPGWLLLDEAESLFRLAKARLWTVDQAATKQITFHCEDNPKWALLREVVQEALSWCSLSETGTATLVLVKDSLQADLLTEYLQAYSPRTILLERLASYLGRSSATHGAEPALAASAEAESSRNKINNNYNHPVGFSIDDKEWGVIGEIEPDRAAYPVLISAVREGGSDRAGLLMRELKHPRIGCIVLFDPDQHIVREVECFQARNQAIRLRVYLLLFQDSIEEQKYLTSLHKEQQAFESLVREKAQMAYQDPKDRDRTLIAPSPPTSSTSMQRQTRKGGLNSDALAVAESRGCVIVDVREFRSKLPGLLYAAGIQVIPKTLLVADYILSPSTAVERKSVPDLFQSFSSGRLFHQAEQLCRNFSIPILLIEFDHSEVFMLQDKAVMSGLKIAGSKKAAKSTTDQPSDALSTHQISSKLALLTLHFPSLRIIWSRSPYETAELFQELKKDQPQPSVSLADSLNPSDLDRAAATEGEEDAAVESADRYAPVDMVKQMPGITEKNASRLLGAVAVVSASSHRLAPLAFKKTTSAAVSPPVSLIHLVQYTKSQLAELLGSESEAAKLFKFLHSTAEQLAVTMGKK